MVYCHKGYSHFILCDSFLDADIVVTELWRIGSLADLCAEHKNSD